MNLTLVCVGKVKEAYLRDGIAEYRKRLTRYADVRIEEVDDERTEERLSDAEKRKILDAEAARILKKVPDGAYLVTLEIGGKMFSSETLASMLGGYMLNGQADVCLVIGGSLGLSPLVTGRAMEHWSFSKLTFPHQLMRLILLEQLYRGFRILKGEPYHK
ncbi:MAG: 23S rRNA (pseudouridine(1915)-N(3))-methyltransferase RlmH [Lachnospiraceae bacterium]|nr:23S rRNA (pseudouridine(1915)-N(3))-methyltransferase RlmH [Lachnospiraceae bacterium]